MAAIALVEEMLDAAETAHVDLWALELRRRRLLRDIAAYDLLVDHLGAVADGANELRRSIESGVAVLAEAFVYMRSLVKGGADNELC